MSTLASRLAWIAGAAIVGWQARGVADELELELELGIRGELELAVVELERAAWDVLAHARRAIPGGDVDRLERCLERLRRRR